jgi:lipopolysaccharide export LptBFGC system permease protein LptF
MNKTFTTFIVKKILFYFGVSFLCLFALFFANQILLVAKDILNPALGFSPKALLLLYMLPSAFVMSLPYAVCIGFTLGLIKIRTETGSVSYRKLCGPVLCLGLLAALLDFAVIDGILPGATSSFTKLYRSIHAAQNTVKNPREMNIQEIVSGIHTLRNNSAGRTLNIYKMELHKKFVMPLGIVLFALFAFLFSIVIKNYLKIGAAVSFLISFINWAVLLYSQTFVIKTGRYPLVIWLADILLAVLIGALYCYQASSKPLTEK